MRIADTLLRGGHLSEDALVDAWYAGDHPAHLDTCDVCAERAMEMSRWLEQTREIGIAEADAAFPAERLAAQQSQILRKLELADRPAKLLSFPRATAPVMGVHGEGHNHRVSTRWAAVAAAAALILGVIGGRLSVWEPAAAPATRAAAQQAPAPKAPEIRSADPVDLLLESNDSTEPLVHSLSAIDTLTPSATVARASTTRRR